MINTPKDSLSAATPSAPGRPELKAVQSGPAPQVKAPAAPAVTPRKPKPKPKPKPKAVQPPVPTVGKARRKRRHYAALASFALLVLLPFLGAVGYLYVRAADQYHSDVAFSIRSEDRGAPAGLLGAITQIGTGTSDADILYEYIRSQKIVEDIDADLDLRALYNQAGDDVVFALGDDAAIEQLVGYWRRMVDVSLDSTAGIIHVRANAFTPEAARAITRAILAESSQLVNQLSDQAREDAVSFARTELAEAERNLRAVRQRLGQFRRDNRIVDPAADAEGQMGLLSALQKELAQALVERDMLRTYADANDQRVVQANRKIDAVTARIEDERTNLGVSGARGEALSDVIGAYEELQVDIEFASSAYTQALAGLTAARAEAGRQSRYLAPHIVPTLAQSALYPRRPLIAGLTGLFLFLGWAVVMLVYYNVRDRR